MDYSIDPEDASPDQEVIVSYYVSWEMGACERLLRWSQPERRDRCIDGETTQGICIIAEFRETVQKLRHPKAGDGGLYLESQRSGGRDRRSEV